MWWNEKYRYVWMSRQQLHDHVWSKPRTKLKKEFGISDVMITKICKKHNIPVPSRGYWQKLEAGKKLHPDKLPIQKDEEQIRVRQMISEEPAEKQEPEAVLRQREYEERAGNLIVVPARLSNPLPLVKKAKEELEDGEPNGNGLVDRHYKGILDIIVSPANIHHAVLIMDTLGKALKARGFELKHENMVTFAVVNGESVAIKLAETLKSTPHITDKNEKGNWEKDHPWGKYREKKTDRAASGRMRLKIIDSVRYMRHTWFSPVGKDPGEYLNECIIALVRHAEEIKEDKRRREREKREREAETERSRLERRVVKTYKANMQRLTEAAENYDLALKIRRYTEAMEPWVRECMGADYEGSKPAEWIAWSKMAADKLDPAKGDTCPRVETEEDFQDWWLESTYDDDEFKPQRKRG